ncbi:uncharacterized protein LOC105684087 [Athalia rosae]|uniref:uncharacterized protein LOC105684087 n=1 Tax=Athalia rosae TaxID=37344 RepID=UPI002034384D|nr:uncharacterized protein LOC105684087 [Athalia rosae]
MQLATAPRPHPPPVPPRPSRQVVAEALKRSPRPPCPTRQAPPPPDTKPWRAQEQENVPKTAGPPAGAGRTIVYESALKGVNGESREVGEIGGADKNVLARLATDEKLKDKNLTSGTVDQAPIGGGGVSARDLEILQRQQQQQLGVRILSERNERNASNLQMQMQHGQRQRPTPVERHQLQVSHNNLRVHQLRLINAPRELPEPTKNAEQNANKQPKFTNQRHIQVVNGAVVFEAHNPQVKVTREQEDEVNTFPQDTQKPDILPAIEFEKINSANSVIKPERIKDSDTRRSPESPETVETKEKENRITESKEEDDLKPKTPPGKISHDDCATVVAVVDEPEPERKVAFEDSVNIQHEDWLEAGVRYSSTKITLSGDEVTDEAHDSSCSSAEEQFSGFDDYREEFTAFDFASIKEKIAMSSLQGLPPLPRSLSGFNLNTNRDGNEPPPPPARSSSKPQRGARGAPGGGRPSTQGRQLTTLDGQLATLRREMFGLRQLDLSLLSQLWSLNESIQEFRHLLQEQDDRAPSPSPSSEEGDDTSYGSHPPPHPRRPPPVTHHHRAPRPPPRNDSPSSEEYGAV